MSLIVHDTISLTTSGGVSSIQLCIGDITKLSKEEQVDVLVVSAFPGDYSPTPSSLIGALSINLGISVRNLSQDKEEDLRKQYFCWWSKPLHERHSFRRILCFEGGFGSRGSSPPKVVGAVFRCLIPILSGKDSKGGSVIMPLLASGDQGYSKALMLRLIMNSAIQWIKTGLELKTLKVVLFSRNPTKPDKSHEPLFESFQKLKDTYGDKELTSVQEIIYDVYMSHCPKDHQTALNIAKFLRTERKIKVFHDFQELNDDDSWQEEIFNIMGKCARVIALLSPGYLETESCIEQYNMALCIDRRSQETVLAPFYITSMDYMPTYMSLIQYEDCRQKDTEKIKAASHHVANSLKRPQEDVLTGVTETKTIETLNYDVFISYSHQNKAHAEKVLQTLTSLDPELKIFIDTSGLNTGTSWQQKLYNSLDASRSTIALLSPDYIKSRVCYEEFCLSHALFVDKDSMMDLVSVLVEPVEKLPLWCEQPLPVDCTPPEVDADQVLSSVCTDLVNRLKGANNAQRVQDLKKGSLTLESSMEHHRKSVFVLRSGVLSKPVNLTTSNDEDSLRASHTSDAAASVDGQQAGVDPSTHNTSTEVTSSSSTSSQLKSSSSATCDVALSFASGDSKSAMVLKQLLLEKIPSLKISEPKAEDFSRVQSLDVARVIVPLLSSAFLTSNELVQELNIAICRNRGSPRRVLFPVPVGVVPPKPSYVHLIPSEFSCNDYRWACKVLDQALQNEVHRLAHGNDIDVDLAFCLRCTAFSISERLLGEESKDLDLDNRVLLNVHEVEEKWRRVQMALQQEDGLAVSWKAAFGIKIETNMDDLKPAGNTEELEVKPEVNTEDTMAEEIESNGVELHRNDISNESENTCDQPGPSEHGVEAGSNEPVSPKEHKTVHFNVDGGEVDGSNSSTRAESKACLLI